MVDRRAEYRAYLQTAGWSGKRSEALACAGGRCQVCNSEKRLDVHHRTYERLGEEEPGDLTVLCRQCHELFHGSSNLRGRPRRRPKKKLEKKLEKKRAKDLDKLSVLRAGAGVAQGSAAAELEYRAARVESRLIIDKGKSARGGWKRKQLAKWGIPWPPPKGWKYRLEKDLAATIVESRKKEK